MQWHDIEQNTEEWLLLRAGKVTGSSVSKVMANFGKDFGDPAKRMAVDLAIQQITGKAELSNSYSNEHMERGHEQEPIARLLYEDEHFCEVTNGGFFDNGFTGCSPDGMVGDGIIEIKSVIASTQYKTIKRGTFDSAYKWQIIFNLKESKANWLDYISYSADFPLGKQLFVKRLFKEEFEKEFIQIDERLNEYEKVVNDIKENIINLA